MKLDDEALADCVWLLLHTISMSSTWKPVEDMRRLGIIEKLLFIIGEAGNWTNMNIRNEIVKSSLDVRQWFFDHEFLVSVIFILSFFCCFRVLG